MKLLFICFYHLLNPLWEYCIWVMNMQILFQYVWTPIAVFLVGYFLLRWMGKKAVAEMNSFDLLVTLILATTIAEPIATKRLGVASYYALALAIVYILFSNITLKNRFKKILTSKPTVLVKEGNINKKGLRKVRMTVNELLAELRVKGYSDVKDVSLAMLEEVGKISVIPKAELRSVEPRDVQIEVKPTYIPIALIVDGEIIDQNLESIHRDRHWLLEQLAVYKIHPDQVQNVTLATFNQQKVLDVDIPRDKNDEIEYFH